MNGVVCLPCRQQRHSDCPGLNWCDCQHQPLPGPPEPVVGWIRQG
jgi:hypothetical protein